MKKPILFLLTICIFYGNPVNAQGGRLLNKISNASNNVLGKSATNSGTSNQKPEPKCACAQPELIFDLGGNLKLMYSEINISIKDDGSVLVKDIISNNYYIAKDGATQGPIKDGDPRLKGFDIINNQEAEEGKNRWINNEYITRSGDKYLIKFGGKNYGPYGEISDFKVTRSKGKFAAMVIENVVANEDEGKKMEEAMKNAKTDQERMDLAMKYSQIMQQKMMQGGGPTSMVPKFVTNIPGVNFDPMTSGGGELNANVKYDDILVTAYDKIMDLQGKVVLNLKSDAVGIKDLFVNTSNTKYAYYKYGTLTFGDGTSLTDMFTPRLTKVSGQVYLAYMYYSPKRNAIMQCKIPF